VTIRIFSAKGIAVPDDPTLQKVMDVWDQLKGKNSGKRVDDWKVQ
jgi:hypothetical protein